MKRLTVITSFTLALCINSTALAQETVRLVFSHAKKPVLASQSLQTYSVLTATHKCILAPDGLNQWCIEGETLQKSYDTKKQAKSSAFRTRFEAVELPSYGYNAKTVAKLFNADGRFGLVEADVKVTTADSVTQDSAHPQSENITLVDDPSYNNWQTYYFTDADTSPAGINIEGLWRRVGEPNIQEKNAPLDVLIVDSGFFIKEDVVYYSGRNFSTTAVIKDGPRQVPSDDYSPPAEIAEMCSSHGLSVSSIVGATINNGQGIAGVTNNVNLHAIKTMTCGTGLLSDTANSLHWAAGEHFEGVTPYGGNPGIVNMSLGGTVEKCPVFMQEAIDNALKAGFTLVAAAGNDSRDSSSTSPANCQGVIAVGALSRDGYLASFTNFGRQLSIMAQGENIAGMCKQSDAACNGAGTSFAAPLVAASLAVIKQQTGVDDATLKLAMTLTARSDTLDPQCDTGICGEGLLNAGAALDVAILARDGMLNRIEFALDGKDPCVQQWYLDYFGNLARLCELYKVTFMDGYAQTDDTFQLISIANGETWTDTAPQIDGIFNKATVMLESLELSSRQYGVQVCKNDNCGDVQPLNADRAASNMRPASCP
jgi:serine protease